MNNLGASVAKSMAQDKLASIKNKLTGSNKPKIDWNHFNYPPLIKVMHYSIDELEPPYKGMVRLMWFTHILIFSTTLLNIIGNIAQAAMYDDKKVKIRVLYAFVFLIIFNPLQTLSFYFGYRGLCDDNSLLKKFKILTILLTILYIIFSIANFASFDGWVRVGELFGDGSAFPGVVALIESFLLTFCFALQIFLVYKIHYWDSTSSSSKE